MDGCDTMKLFYYKKNMICKMSQYHLKAHCDGLSFYIPNSGTTYKKIKGSIVSIGYKIYSVTVGSSYQEFQIHKFKLKMFLNI